MWDANPLSKTYYKGPWGEVPYPMTTMAIPAGVDTLQQAQAKAITMATNQLQLILGSFDDFNLTTVPNPALRGSRLCLLTLHSAIKVNADYVISNMTIPLGVGSSAGDDEMAVGFRPRIQAA